MPHLGEPTPEGPGKRRFCRITTGSYTGDGSTDLYVTGINFRPKIVMLWIYSEVPLTTGAGKVIYMKTDTMFGDLCISVTYGISSNKLIALDADGFHVDDNGADSHPNKTGQVYNYIAFG